MPRGAACKCWWKSRSPTLEKPTGAGVEEDAGCCRSGTSSATRRLGALAKRGKRPIFIDAERLSGFKRRGADVDVVLDLMIHDLDLCWRSQSAEVSEGPRGFAC